MVEVRSAGLGGRDQCVPLPGHLRAVGSNEDPRRGDRVRCDADLKLHTGIESGDLRFVGACREDRRTKCERAEEVPDIFNDASAIDPKPDEESPEDEETIF